VLILYFQVVKTCSCWLTGYMLHNQTERNPCDDVISDVNKQFQTSYSVSGLIL